MDPTINMSQTNEPLFNVFNPKTHVQSNNDLIYVYFDT